MTPEQAKERGIKVRPLRWTFFDVKHDYGCGLHDANAANGVYSIMDCADSPFKISERFYVLKLSASFADLERAKEACQADHDAEVLRFIE